MIKNPVIKGFHPDPCMIFVEGWFYIANSTFEYYPGVKISRSKDLANWEFVCYPLKDKKHINMFGTPVSTGIWAPCLTYNGGKFYLVYTDMKTWITPPFKDSPNYITTCETIDGEWSDPIYINSSGFDPSLFHDEDGRKYFVNMEWDFREEENDKYFSGILLTELNPETLKPISRPVKIFEGTDRGSVEGPHIYKKDEYYYLLCAEGGTSYAHAESVARSKNIAGAYEIHPNKLLASAFGDEKSPIQKTGHGSLCQDGNGRWWFAFLCGRPIDESKRCVLGRETGIAEVIWKNDWPYLKSGGIVPAETFEGYGEQVPKKNIFINNFAKSKEFEEFMNLRIPARTKILPDGKLRLYGRESQLSTQEQTMVLTRQDAFECSAELVMDFDPKNYRQYAGIIYRYSDENQYLFKVSWNDELNQRAAGVYAFDQYNFTMTPIVEEIPLGIDKTIVLKLDINRQTAVFSAGLKDEKMKKIKEIFDTTILSDEHATPLGFTGAFIGMAAYDLEDHTSYMDVHSFEYSRKM